MPSNERNIAVIFINWFHAGRTIASVARIGRWRRLHPAVFVVCNGDTPAGRASLRDACTGHARFLELPNNAGFAGGNNAGIRAALEAGFDKIALINTDAEIAEDDFATLLQAFGQVRDLAAASPLIVERDGARESVYAGGQDISRARQTRIVFGGEGSNARFTHPDHLMGTVLVTRSAAWRRVGPLDEAYFFSGEVADWCERARAQGFALAVDREARAFHDAAMAGDGARDGDYLYYSLRNRFLFIARHRVRRKAFLFARWTVIALFEAAKALATGRFNRARACLAAARDGVRGRWGARHPAGGAPGHG
ncbi:MAG: glycosyltransferase family 2 protein [Nitratireductor sp.]|nr:glycosyltransferase family 2 protein [Nitratireductor sp.]